MQGVAVTQEDRRKLQAWRRECASILDEPATTAGIAAQRDMAAAPSAASEAGYLFEGQLSQVSSCITGVSCPSFI